MKEKDALYTRIALQLSKALCASLDVTGCPNRNVARYDTEEDTLYKDL